MAPDPTTLTAFVSFPNELVHEIILHILDATPSSDNPDEPRSDAKPNWTLISSLTVASKTYRTLALGVWFRTLTIRSPSDILYVENTLPDIGAIWARELHCIPSDTSKVVEWDLTIFRRITRLRIDWSSFVTLPVYASYNHTIHGPGYQLPFRNPPSSLIEFDIRGLTWPSPLTVQHIAPAFPHLRILRMQQPKIWCSLCNTCSVARFREPGPEKLIYENGLGLPMHYARVLSPLSHLHTVILTVADCGSGKTTLGTGDTQNPNMWTGECDRCMEVMYADAIFLERWLARKKGIAMGLVEGEMIYQRPPALRRVEWRFWKGDGEDDDNDDIGIESDYSSE